MDSPSCGSIHEIIQLSHALRSGGLSQEAMKALLTTPAIAQAAAQAAMDAYWRNQNNTLVLDISLSATSLPKREFNILRRIGVVTVGELALCNEETLRLLRGAGDGVIENISKVLGFYGLTLLKEPGSEFAHAVSLYDGADFVPARHMRLWTEGLNQPSLLYLRRIDTLGDLSAKSRDEFITEHRQLSTPRELLEDTSAEQAELVASGLQSIGLSFYGEE